MAYRYIPIPSMEAHRKSLSELVQKFGQDFVAKEIGCSQQSVSAWLRQSTPRKSMMRRLLTVLRTPVRVLEKKFVEEWRP